MEVPCFYCVCSENNAWINLQVSAKHCQEIISVVLQQENNGSVLQHMPFGIPHWTLLDHWLQELDSRQWQRLCRPFAIPVHSPHGSSRVCQQGPQHQRTVLFFLGTPGAFFLQSCFSHMGPAGSPVPAYDTHMPQGCIMCFVWKQAACFSFVGSFSFWLQFEWFILGRLGDKKQCDHLNASTSCFL